MARKYFTLVVLLMMSTWAFGQSFDYSISPDASAHEGGGNTALEVEPPPEVIVYGTTFAADGSGFQLNMPGGSTMQDMGESLSSSGGLFNSGVVGVAIGSSGSAIQTGAQAGGGWLGGWGYQGSNNAQAVGALGSIALDILSHSPVAVEGMGGGIEGIPLPESMRNFSAKDLILGHYDPKLISEFRFWGGGLKGQWGKIGVGNANNPDFILPQVRKTIADGGLIRFNLKGFSIKAAMNPESRYYWERAGNWTGKEYNAIITHWEEFKDYVLFYTGPYPY